MKKNNFTCEEIYKLMKQKMEENNTWYLEEKDLLDLGIYFEAVSNYTYRSKPSFSSYFLCKDGLFSRHLCLNTETGIRFFHESHEFHKVNEYELATIAKTFHQRKIEAEQAHQDVSALDSVLHSQKLRGFFLKQKYSK